MYAKYIKQEYADLNGTGHTQAYYKMLTIVMGLTRQGSLSH